MANQITTPTQKFPTIDFKIELLRHGIEQKDIAERLDISKPFISQIITGAKSMSSSRRVSDFLMLIFEDMQAGRFTRLEDYDARPAD